MTAVGRSASEAEEVMQSVAKRFTELNIPFEITDHAGSSSVETLGLEFMFGDRITLTNKKSRAWSLYLATKGILRRKRVSGDLLRIWLGHVNFFFQLARPALSALSATYKFAARHLGRRGAIWPNVRHELRTVMGLIFLVEYDLAPARSELVHLGDSSVHGFSIMSTQATRDEIDLELKVRERWRFLEGRQMIGLGVVEMDDNAVDAFHEKGHEACNSVGCSTSYGQMLSRS